MLPWLPNYYPDKHIVQSPPGYFIFFALFFIALGKVADFCTEMVRGKAEIDKWEIVPDK